MAYKKGTAKNFRDLVRQIRNFTVGYREDTGYSYSASATKDNELQFFGAKLAVDETWTLTCTTAGGNGVGIFSVVGSVTGTLATATVGRYYDTPEVCFIIERNEYDFGAGETFTIAVSGEAATVTEGVNWQLMQETVEDDAPYSDNWTQMQTTGIAGDKTVNIFMLTKANVDRGTFGIGMSFATGYVPGGYPSQPGYYSDFVYLYSSDREMPFWIFVNKQRIIVLNRSAVGVYHSAYAGLFYPYGTPGQYANPIYVGATCDNFNWPYWSSNTEVRHFLDPANGAGNIRMPGPPETNEKISHFDSDIDGGNRNLTKNQIWPYGTLASTRHWESLRESEDGSYPMFKPVLVEVAPYQVLGELDGVCAIPGYNLDPESTITRDADQFVVWRHPTDPAPNYFFAVRIA